MKSALTRLDTRWPSTVTASTQNSLNPLARRAGRGQHHVEDRRHVACESLAVGGQCKSPVWQGTQERGARTSRSRRWTSLPSAIRSDTAGSAKPAPRPVPSAQQTTSHPGPCRHASRAPRRHAVTRTPCARSWQPRRPTAVGVPSGHTETHGQRTAPRPTSAIAASGQLPEDWPSSGQVHRRVATRVGTVSRRMFSLLAVLLRGGDAPVGAVRDAGHGRGGLGRGHRDPGGRAAGGGPRRPSMTRTSSAATTVTSPRSTRGSLCVPVPSRTLRPCLSWLGAASLIR